jgi:hypothetical protein
MSSPLASNQSDLPLLQQPYHQEADAVVVDRLTPEEEEPGAYHYQFTDLQSGEYTTATEFDYRESNRTSRSDDGEDGLYCRPHELSASSADHYDNDIQSDHYGNDDDIQSDRPSCGDDDNVNLYLGPRETPASSADRCDNDILSDRMSCSDRDDDLYLGPCITPLNTSSLHDGGDDDVSLYGADLPDINPDGSYTYPLTSGDDSRDLDYYPGSDNESRDMDFDTRSVDAADVEEAIELIQPDGVFWDYQEVNGETKRVRLKICDKCKIVISLGDGKGLHAYFQHQDSGRCRSAAKLLGKKKQPTLSDLWKPRPAVSAVPSPDITPSISPSPSSPPMSPAGTAGHKTFPARNDSLPTIFTLLLEARLCPGVELDYSGSTFRRYPWQLHEFENLSFLPEYFGSHGNLYIRSKKCHQMPRRQGEACSECLSLNTSAEINRLRARATGVMPVTTNFKYYSFDQLHEVLERKNKEKDVYRLEASCPILVQILN